MSVATAQRLAAAGRRSEAVLMMNQLAAAGDADAVFALGLWRLGGGPMPGDIVQARELFRRAGEHGRRDGTKVYANLLASGTGGPADWAGAVRRLDSLARHDAASKAALNLIRVMNLTAGGEPLSVPVGEMVHESPQVLCFRDLLSAGECDHLVRAAAPLMRPSVIVDERTGQQRPHPIRTSDGATFAWILADPAVTAINRRIAAASGTDFAQGEPLQVLRYRPGQEYRRHLDAISGMGNQRILTMIVYLSDDYEGGEIQFPRTGFTFRGRKGDGLLFRNVLPDGRPDPDSEHAGLPVRSGTKLIASRWIRERPFLPRG